MTDSKTRLEKAVQRRDHVSLQIQRLEGRREEAERALEALENECKARGIDPSNIEETVSKLEEALEASLSAVETKIDEAEKALSRFTTV